MRFQERELLQNAYKGMVLDIECRLQVHRKWYLQVHLGNKTNELRSEGLLEMDPPGRLRDILSDCSLKICRTIVVCERKAKMAGAPQFDIVPGAVLRFVDVVCRPSQRAQGIL